MSKLECANKILEGLNGGLEMLTSGLDNLNKEMKNYVTEKEADERFIQKKKKIEELKRKMINS